MQQVRITAVPLPAVLTLVVATILFGLGLYTGIRHPPLPTSTDSSPGSAVSIGGEAPRFGLPTLNGDSVQLSDFLGRPVVLFFWADWCSLCSDELAYLIDLSRQQAEQDVEVLAINIMQEDAVLQEFAKRHPSGVRLLADTEAEVSRLYGVVATPTYVFIDRSGRLTARIVGGNRREAVEGRLHAIATKK